MKKKILLSIFLIALISTLFGFQTMNHKDFFVLFNHKIGESYQKIQLLNKKSNLAKLGKEEVDGKISGKIYYHAKVSGLGGLVTIRYENYCDEEGWIFNGEIITKANIKGNGNFDGKVDVNGLYNASVYFDKVTLGDNLPNSGSYGVSFNREKRVEVPYQAYFEWFVIVKCVFVKSSLIIDFSLFFI